MCEANPDMFQFYLACASLVSLAFAVMAWEVFGTEKTLTAEKFI